MGTVRFILDGAVREVDPPDTNQTVLEYLRGERRCGTKEGCAEGDCGACTVVLAELRDGRPRLRALNSCLLPLPTLDGKALFTVESLRGRDGTLHAVQRAMVECHASQCGFCTPGFVMSIYALFESEPEPTRERIDEVLAGNLCRCTGYRPIVAAVHQAYAIGQPGRAAAGAELVERLAALRRARPLAIEHADRRYYAPHTVSEVTALLARHPGAHLLAGGTDLGLLVTKEHRPLETIVYLGSVDELTAIKRGSTHFEIGAAATYTDVLEAVGADHPALASLLRRIGALQIRNAGTLGGNLGTGSPIGDSLPALMALDATVVVAGPESTRELSLEQFLVGYRRTALRPGELVTRIRIPLPARGREFRTYKVAKRFDQDISAVCAAFSLEIRDGVVRDARLCFGGVAATTRRARAGEAALLGQPFTERAIQAAAAAVSAELSPITDLRASAAYRRLVAGNLLRKFHTEVMDRPRAARVAQEVP
jgi:xanthine dehydrogenase small subunit